MYCVAFVVSTFGLSWWISGIIVSCIFLTFLRLETHFWALARLLVSAKIGERLPPTVNAVIDVLLFDVNKTKTPVVCLPRFCFLTLWSLVFSLQLWGQPQVFRSRKLQTSTAWSIQTLKPRTPWFIKTCRPTVYCCTVTGAISASAWALLQ